MAETKRFACTARLRCLLMHSSKTGDDFSILQKATDAKYIYRRQVAKVVIKTTDSQALLSCHSIPSSDCYTKFLMSPTAPSGDVADWETYLVFRVEVRYKIGSGSGTRMSLVVRQRRASLALFALRRPQGQKSIELAQADEQINPLCLTSHLNVIKGGSEFLPRHSLLITCSVVAGGYIRNPECERCGEGSPHRAGRCL